ncbi:MAG: response regulator receiver protein [Clostridia bacterium]|jgi:two-component system response regulator YesN|nr:response regulator receiver protein [Clostridia bacterium]
MFKVLIADDEPKIRKGIKNILDWGMLDFEIIAEAEDGEVAFERAAATTPDLLLVDICMPFINGLELIHKLQSVLNNPVIIIISGHDEFEYAQQALKLKVFDYILKPVEKEVLLSAVIRAKQHIISRRNKSIKEAFTLKQLKKSSHYLKETFLQEWIQGQVKEEEAARQFAYFNIGQTSSMGLILIRLTDKSTAIMEEGWDIELLAYAIENIAREAMQGFKELTSFIDTKNQIVLISDSDPITKWNGLGISIERYIEQYLKREVIIEAQLIDSQADIKNAYQEVCARLIERSQKTPIVGTIQRYLEKHYSNPELSLTQIAGEIGISQTYLTRLLKQELGFSFIDYLTQVRLKKAVVLMQDPHIKVYEVAEMVGYTSQHYFSKVFKKAFNISPLDYKRGGKK